MLLCVDAPQVVHAQSQTDASRRPYEYTAPDKTADGWETASIGDVHLNRGLIADLCERISDDTYKNISSVVIVKDGKLVVEEYFPQQELLGDRRSRALRRVAPQQLYSATKSVTSILIGIAIDRGLIRNVDEKVSTFFPEYADLFAGPEKARLCLRDFLAMSAGMQWDKWTHGYSDPRNDALNTLLSDDPLRYVLERPVVAPPGIKFSYNTGISPVLGEIVRKASGLRADNFAEHHLFDPLGITDYYWAKVPDDMVETGGGLFLRPRDMAKLGQLYLNGGRWQGVPVVGEDWVKESTKNQAGTMELPVWLPAADGYGYQWWLGALKADTRDVRYYGA